MGLGLLLVVMAAAWSMMDLSDSDALRKYPGLMEGLLPGLIVLGLVMMGVGWWAGRELRRNELKGWATLALGGALIAGTAMHSILPIVDEQRSYRPAAGWLVQRTQGDAEIGYYWPGREANKRPGWLCHLKGRRFVFLDDPAVAMEWLNQSSDALLLTTPVLAGHIPANTPVAKWRISSTSWVVLKGSNRDIGRGYEN